MLQHLCSYVRPTLEYTSSIWSHHLLSDINRIEMIQRRSVRFVYNDITRTLSITSMLNNLNWPSLKYRRDVVKVTMFLRLLVVLFHFHMTTYFLSFNFHPWSHSFFFLPLSNQTAELSTRFCH